MDKGLVKNNLCNYYINETFLFIIPLFFGITKKRKYFDTAKLLRKVKNDNTI